MQDRGYGLPRTPLLGTSVNKDKNKGRNCYAPALFVLLACEVRGLLPRKESYPPLTTFRVIDFDLCGYLSVSVLRVTDEYLPTEFILGTVLALTDDSYWDADRVGKHRVEATLLRVVVNNHSRIGG